MTVLASLKLSSKWLLVIMLLPSSGGAAVTHRAPDARQIQIQAKDFTLLVPRTAPVSGRMLKAYNIAFEAVKHVSSLSLVSDNLARYHVIFEDLGATIRLHLIPGSDRTAFHLRCGRDFCPIVDMTVDTKHWELTNWLIEQ